MHSEVKTEVTKAVTFSCVFHNGFGAKLKSAVEVIMEMRSGTSRGSARILFPEGFT